MDRMNRMIEDHAAARQIPISAPAETPSVLHRAGNVPILGIDSRFSHLETACTLMHAA